MAKQIRDNDDLPSFENAKGSEEGFKLLNRYFYNKDVQDITDGYWFSKSIQNKPYKK